MALLPIAWDIETGIKIVRDGGRGNNSRLKPIFDFPATRNLGTAFGTSFTLKLHLGKDGKRNWKASNQKTICIELERFCNLSALSIQGSLSLSEIITHKRIGLKSFQHSFKNGEKSFLFQMNLVRDGLPLRRMFSGLSLHGHICVDSSTSDDDTKCINGESDMFCPLPEIHKAYSLLSNDFQRMLHDPRFSDVTLNCGGEKFTVHKSVLSSRSPVFKAMFENNMKESRSDEIPISDVEPAALRVLLKYIYCGKIDDLSDAAACCDVLYAADKYDLPVLKENCVSYLKTAITLDNVCLILNSAVLHDENLKCIAFNYVIAHSNAILETDEWKAFEEARPHIYKDIFRNLCLPGLKNPEQSPVAQ